MTKAVLEFEGEQSAFSRIFHRDAVLFAAIVCLLPNLLFLLASPFYLAERMISPILYLAVGMVSLFVPRWLGLLLFLLVAAIDLGLIIMFAFHLPIEAALKSLQYIGTLDIAGSMFYLILVSAMIVTTLSCFLGLQANRQRFRASSPILATLIAMGLAWYDWSYTFPYFAKSKGEFDSAMLQTGLDAGAIAGKRKNLLVVMVEGLGAYKYPKHRNLLETELLNGLPENRFDFETGSTRYSGSTTAATARELCGVHGDYLTFLEATDADFENCLPYQLRQAGYQTGAYHAFGTEMFARHIWYPKIGIQKLDFMGSLAENHGPKLRGRCGSVFLGLCDTEVGNVVKADLLAAAEKPKFVYWLTLNSHIPYTATTESRLACSTKNASISNKTVCELTELWLEVFKKVNEIAADPHLPPTDILVVGDHHTPLWEVDAKNHFLLHKVDWFLLRDRRPGAEMLASMER